MIKTKIFQKALAKFYTRVFKYRDVDLNFVKTSLKLHIELFAHIIRNLIMAEFENVFVIAKFVKYG